jgi:hypothetical protein
LTDTTKGSIFYSLSLYLERYLKILTSYSYNIKIILTLSLNFKVKL